MRDLEEAIEICICTFRRASLAETLRSLDGSHSDVPVSILVVDNDDDASAKPLVDEFAATSDLPVLYVHCPGANISIARNAVLHRARARFLAFLDDDETATKNWLGHLRETLSEIEAAAVLGPVHAVYDKTAPNWMRNADLHSTSPVFVGDEIKTGYSCNVMIDRQQEAFDGLDFDLGLGRTGGEDTAFFTELFERGGKIAYAPDAVVYEKVPTERASFAWLAKRRFRMGQTHGRLLLREADVKTQISGGLTAVAKSFFCVCLALFEVFNPARRNTALLRGCLHAGTLSAHLGLRTLELYGKKNKGVMP